MPQDTTTKPHIAVLAVTNDLVADQRVHRIASSLADAGYQVLCIGRRYADSPELGQRPYATARMHLHWRSGKLFYAEYNFRLFFRLLFTPADVITANDLDTLLPCWLVARLRRKRLVYDAHELFTEVPELIHRPATRRAWLALERLLLPRIRHFSTVSNGVAREYAARYPTTPAPVVVRNVPFRANGQHRAQWPGSGQRILLYQGAVNLGRGIDLMIACLAYLPSSCRLRIIGGGDVLPQMQALAQELELADRVEFLGKKPFDQLPPLTAEASLGLSLEEDLGLNYRYASPNKVFDYFRAGLPVVVADLPEMGQIVTEAGAGLLLHERTPQALAALVQQVCENEQLWQQYAAAAAVAGDYWCWENEQEKLWRLYPKPYNEIG